MTIFCFVLGLLIILTIIFFVVLEIKFRKNPETSIQLNYNCGQIDLFKDDRYYYLPFSIDNVSEVVATIHDVSCILLEPKVKILDVVSVGYPQENYFKTSLVHPKSGIPIIVLLPKEDLKNNGKLQIQIKYSGRRNMSLHLSKFHFNFSNDTLRGAVVYEKAYTN